MSAFQVLFGYDQGNSDGEQTLSMLVQENELTAKDIEYVHFIIQQYEQHKNEIDEIIARHLTKQWSLARLGAVERTILRLGALEILFVDDVPQRVAINEALEMAKLFADHQSTAIINGVLDKIN